jgi:hypothetical protein
MLTEREEQILREQIRNNTPMPSMNEVRQPLGYQPLVTPLEIERWMKAPKLQPVSLNDDQLVKDKLRGAGFKGQPGEFYSRVGIGRAELIRMSHDQIRAAIERTKDGDDIEPPHNTTAFLPTKPSPAPRGRTAILVG